MSSVCVRNSAAAAGDGLTEKLEQVKAGDNPPVTKVVGDADENGLVIEQVLNDSVDRGVWSDFGKPSSPFW